MNSSRPARIAVSGRPSAVAAPIAARALETLCRAVGESGRGVCAVNGGDGLSFRDTYRLQPKVGVPFTYTAILTTPNGGHLKAMEIHRVGRAEGADVWPQVSCRPLSFSMTMIEPFSLNTNPVFAELIPQSLDARRAAYADPAWRDRVREAWKTTKGIAPRWDAMEIMETSRPELSGANLGRLAGERGVDPFDLLLDITLAEPDLAVRVKAMLANDDVARRAVAARRPLHAWAVRRRRACRSALRRRATHRSPRHLGS